MSICYPDYRIASGHDVALAGLQNIVTLIQQQTGRLLLIAPRSQPVNPFPVETPLGSGRVAGDGKPTHEWVFDGLPIAAFTYILTTYLYTTGAKVKSKAVTIYTPTFDEGSGVYSRFNAYLVYPIPGEDYEYTRKNVVNYRMRFTHLVEL